MDYGHPLERLPYLVTLLQKRLDVLAALARLEGCIPQARRQIKRRVDIGMAGPPADPTTERLLCWPVLAGCIVTA